jgi:hypothetical protein
LNDSIVALSVGASAPAEVQDDAVRVRPAIHRGADELRSVITINALRQSAREPKALQGCRDVVPAEALADIDREALAREQVEVADEPPAAPRKTGGRLVRHSRYYWLLLAESHLTRRLFGAMLRRIWALPVPAG